MFVFCWCIIEVKWKSESVSRSVCPTLYDPVDCSPPGFSVHGILQTRILEWVAIPFSRGSSRPRDRAWVSRIAGRFFTVWTTREAFMKVIHYKGNSCLKNACEWKRILYCSGQTGQCCVWSSASEMAPVSLASWYSHPPVAPSHTALGLVCVTDRIKWRWW